jgi:hypothetical protein
MLNTLWRIFWLDSGYGPEAGSYEHDNEISGFIKGEEFPDKVSYFQLLKKDSAPCS